MTTMQRTLTLPNLPEIAHTASEAFIGINDKSDGSAEVYVYFNSEMTPYIYPHDPYFGDAKWTVDKLTELLTQLDRPSAMTILYSSTVDFRPGDIELPVWT